jgi:enoyl-CoA hydratase/carnithine racemase
VPPGRAGRPEAASSVAPVSSGYERDAASFPRNVHHIRTTKRHSVRGSDLLDVRIEGPAVVLRFRREEKLNAISTEVEGAIHAALDSEQVREARTVVFVGSERAFSAGADLSEARDESLAGIEAYYRAEGSLYERLARLPQPTFAAVSGWCLGGGLELALACDFRIADETAIFGLPEVELGILPSSGGAHRLVRLVGAGRAKELMLLRPRLGAREALAYGLVTEVTARGGALARCLELSERIAELPAQAVATIKVSADTMAEMPREASALVERLAYAALAQTEEARAAAKRWQKRNR